MKNLKVKELREMGEAMSENSFKQLAFRIKTNLWAYKDTQETIDNIWKAYHLTRFAK